MKRAETTVAECILTFRLSEITYGLARPRVRDFQLIGSLDRMSLEKVSYKKTGSACGRLSGVYETYPHVHAQNA
jgi:hypothetical protein